MSDASILIGFGMISIVAVVAIFVIGRISDNE